MVIHSANSASRSIHKLIDVECFSSLLLDNNRAFSISQLQSVSFSASRMNEHNTCLIIAMARKGE